MKIHKMYLYASLVTLFSKAYYVFILTCMSFSPNCAAAMSLYHSTTYNTHYAGTFVTVRKPTLTNAMQPLLITEVAAKGFRKTPALVCNKQK